MTWKQRIRATILLAVVFFAVSMFAPAAQAEAVSWNYCYSSLRGGGALAPDHDILIKAQQFEAQGKHVTSTSHSGWLGDGDGGYRVAELVVFTFSSGGGAVRGFECYGSGSNYHDGWAGY